MRKIAVALGFIEAISLIVFAVSIVINAHRDHSTVGSPSVQAIIFTVFALGLIALSFAHHKGQTWSRTPYLLLQIFAGIIAYTLLSGTGWNAKFVGALVGVIGITAFVAAVKSSN